MGLSKLTWVDCAVVVEVDAEAVLVSTGIWSFFLTLPAGTGSELFSCWDVQVSSSTGKSDVDGVTSHVVGSVLRFRFIWMVLLALVELRRLVGVPCGLSWWAYSVTTASQSDGNTVVKLKSKLVCVGTLRSDESLGSTSLGGLFRDWRKLSDIESCFESWGSCLDLARTDLRVDCRCFVVTDERVAFFDLTEGSCFEIVVLWTTKKERSKWLDSVSYGNWKVHLDFKYPHCDWSWSDHMDDMTSHWLWLFEIHRRTYRIKCISLFRPYNSDMLNKDLL